MKEDIVFNLKTKYCNVAANALMDFLCSNFINIYN